MHSDSWQIPARKHCMFTNIIGMIYTSNSIILDKSFHKDNILVIGIQTISHEFKYLYTYLVLLIYFFCKLGYRLAATSSGEPRLLACGLFFMFVNFNNLLSDWESLETKLAKFGRDNVPGCLS